MSATFFKLFELFLVFGGVFVFLGWQFYSIDKTIKERKAREAASAEADDPANPPA